MYHVNEEEGCAHPGCNEPSAKACRDSMGNGTCTEHNERACATCGGELEYPEDDVCNDCYAKGDY